MFDAWKMPVVGSALLRVFALPRYLGQRRGDINFKTIAAVSVTVVERLGVVCVLFLISISLQKPGVSVCL